MDRGAEERAGDEGLEQVMRLALRSCPSGEGSDARGDDSGMHARVLAQSSE